MNPYQPPRVDSRRSDRWREEIREEPATDWETITVILVVLPALLFSPAIIEFSFLFFKNLFYS